MAPTVLTCGKDSIVQFERILRDLGLEFERLSLKKLPGCTHWHIRTPKARGTLEATFDPKKLEISIEIRANRIGPWQIDVVEELNRLFKELANNGTE